jgi:predicted sulfurtransferase
MHRLAARLIFVIFAVLVIATCATPPPPRQSVGNLTAERLKGLIDRREEVFLVDTRTEYEFKQGHIRGSVNIPLPKFRVIGEILPANKSTHLVFYCRGAA